MACQALTISTGSLCWRASRSAQGRWVREKRENDEPSIERTPIATAKSTRFAVFTRPMCVQMFRAQPSPTISAADSDNLYRVVPPIKIARTSPQWHISHRQSVLGHERGPMPVRLDDRSPGDPEAQGCFGVAHYVWGRHPQTALGALNPLQEAPEFLVIEAAERRVISSPNHARGWRDVPIIRGQEHPQVRMLHHQRLHRRRRAAHEHEHRILRWPP